MKTGGLAFRGLQLSSVVRREKPILGVSHGSRSQLLLSNWLGKPTILIEDYEHCQFPPMMRPTWIMAPDVIPNEVLPRKSENVRKYSGIKEDSLRLEVAAGSEFFEPAGNSRLRIGGDRAAARDGSASS